MQLKYWKIFLNIQTHFLAPASRLVAQWSTATGSFLTKLYRLTPNSVHQHHQKCALPVVVVVVHQQKCTPELMQQQTLNTIGGIAAELYLSAWANWCILLHLAKLVMVQSASKMHQILLDVVLLITALSTMLSYTLCFAHTVALMKRYTHAGMYLYTNASILPQMLGVWHTNTRTCI